MRFQRSLFTEKRCGNCSRYKGERITDECLMGNGIQHCMTSECELYSPAQHQLYSHTEMVKFCDEARQQVTTELIEIADEYQSYIIEDNAPCKLSDFFKKRLSGAE